MLDLSARILEPHKDVGVDQPAEDNELVEKVLAGSTKLALEAGLGPSPVTLLRITALLVCPNPARHPRFKGTCLDRLSVDFETD